MLPNINIGQHNLGKQILIIFLTLMQINIYTPIFHNVESAMRVLLSNNIIRAEINCLWGSISQLQRNGEQLIYCCGNSSYRKGINILKNSVFKKKN